MSEGFRVMNPAQLEAVSVRIQVRLESVARMRLTFLKSVCLAVLLLALCANAQVVHQLTPVEPPTGSTVTFKFDWDEGRPWVRYSITVDDAGKARFEGVGNAIESGDDDKFSQEFTMTDANQRKIFQLAKSLDYFQRNFEAKQKNIAKTGQKTLEFHGRASGGAQPIDSSSTYNYSPNSEVQELTRLFQAMATTLDYGRKLVFKYRFDKLGMDAELTSLQEMQAGHYVEELQAIEPILRKIADDPNMMNINRMIARRLLRSMAGGGTSSQAATQP